MQNIPYCTRNPYKYCNNSKQDLANNLEIQGRKRPRHCAVHLQFVSVFPSLSLCQLSAHSTLLGAVRSGCEDKCGH